MIKKVEKLLTENQIDAAVLTDPYNIRYISGFTSADGMLYVTVGRRVLLTDARYTEQVRMQCPEWECIDIGGSSFIRCLNELMRADNVKSLGFESESISYKNYYAFETEGIQMRLVPLGNQLNSLRMQKEIWELDRLRQAESIGDLAFSHILTVIRPGVTEKEIALELEYTMKKAGASGLSFDTIVASGINSALPHAQPTDRAVKNGDFVTMDFGCIYEGYCSDMTRTIVIGKPDEEQKKIYETVKKAQAEALNVVKAGMKGCEVDAVARKIIYDAGYEGYFGHGLGHSVGLYIHEEPRFSQKCMTIIEANTIMTVEPGIYIPGFGGVRIEDMILVTEAGHDNLTSSVKDLICL